MIISVLRGIKLRNGKYAHIILHFAEGGIEYKSAHIKQLAPFDKCLVNRIAPYFIAIFFKIGRNVGGDDGVLVIIEIEHLHKHVRCGFHVIEHRKIGNIVLVLIGNVPAGGNIGNINVESFRTERPLVLFVHDTVAVQIAADAVAAADFGKGIEIPLIIAYELIKIVLYAELFLKSLVEQHDPCALVIVKVYIAHHEIKLVAERKILYRVLIPPGCGKVDGGNGFKIGKLAVQSKACRIGGDRKYKLIIRFAACNAVADGIHDTRCLKIAGYFAVIIGLYLLDNGFFGFVDRRGVFVGINDFTGKPEHGAGAGAEIMAKNAEFPTAKVLYGNLGIAVRACRG